MIGAEGECGVEVVVTLPMHAEQIPVLWMNRDLVIGVFDVIFHEQRSTTML